MMIGGMTCGEYAAIMAEEKGTEFRRTNRSDLKWIFTLQTEGVVGREPTVAIGNRLLQIDKAGFRNTLAGRTVTIDEHLDGNASE
jgi:hypothetical protein